MMDHEARGHTAMGRARGRAQVRKSDMSTYFEDLAAVRPTQMNIIPRLANMMYDKMMSQLEHTPDGDEHAKAAFKQACASAVAGASWRLAGVTRLELACGLV